MALRERIRIRLKAYDHRVLDQSTTEIVDTAEADRRAGGRPHSAADVANHNHRAALAACGQEIARAVRDSHAQTVADILEPTQQTVDALMKLDLPAGVDVEIKAFGKEHK